MHVRYSCCTQHFVTVGTHCSYWSRYLIAVAKHIVIIMNVIWAKPF